MIMGRLNALDLMKIRQIQDIWERNKSVLKTTSAYQNKQRSLLPLLILEEVSRTHAFRMLMQEARWGAGTAESYWAALHAAGKLVGIPTSKITAEFQKSLTSIKHRTSISWHLSSTSHYEFVTLSYILRLRRDILLEAAMIFTFWMGQRFGDVLKLRNSNIVRRNFPHGPCYAITVVEGKVVPSIGPFTIHAPVHSLVGQLIECYLNPHVPYIFLPQISNLLVPESIAQVTVNTEKLLHAMLKPRDLDIDLRALRRGGLSLMAACGWSKEKIRTFSKHTSDQALDCYLGRGTFDGGTALVQSNIIAMTESFYNSGGLEL